MKTGQYDIEDGKFSHRYLVRKVMKKTAEVSVGISYQGSDMRYNLSYRYPISLLIEQVKNARYTPFKTIH